jgi:hypothetical protein
LRASHIGCAFSASPSEVRASAGGQTIPVRHELAGNLLSITFDGRGEPVNWEACFAQAR